MKEKKHVSFDVVKGTLPKKKKIHYEWEKPQNHVLEPWHFSAVSLTLDVLIYRSVDSPSNSTWLYRAFIKCYKYYNELSSS